MRNHIEANSVRPLQNFKKVGVQVVYVEILLEPVFQVQGSEFRYHLTHALYPVLEKLGSDNALVTQAAYSTLIAMATACGCGYGHSVLGLPFSNNKTIFLTFFNFCHCISVLVCAMQMSRLRIILIYCKHAVILN